MNLSANGGPAEKTDFLKMVPIWLSGLLLESVREMMQFTVSVPDGPGL